MTVKLLPSGGVPADPLGVAAAHFLDALFDGTDIVVEYRARSEHSDPEAHAFEHAPAWSRAIDMGEQWTRLVAIHAKPKAAPVYGTADENGRVTLPAELARIPDVIVRAVRALGATIAVSSPTLPAGFAEAIGEAVMSHIAADFMFPDDRTGRRETAADTLAAVINHLESLSTSRVENRPLSHGVVVAVAPETPDWAPRYPEQLTLSRVAPLFDGFRSVLWVTPEGRAVSEVTESTLARWRNTEDGSTEDLRQLRTRFAGSALLAACTQQLRGVGFLLRDDQTMWMFVNGMPLFIRRGGRWRAIPFASFSAGMHHLCGGAAGPLAVDSALLLSLQKKGGIIAVVDGPEALDGMVEQKDRCDLARSSTSASPLGSPEAAIHLMLDTETIHPTTLARLAAIDGASVIDRHGGLLAYGAIVGSGQSRDEGARTAAARSLSKVSRVVLKVSEDGPISVFVDGDQLARLL